MYFFVLFFTVFFILFSTFSWVNIFEGSKCLGLMILGRSTFLGFKILWGVRILGGWNVFLGQNLGGFKICRGSKYSKNINIYIYIFFLAPIYHHGAFECSSGGQPCWARKVPPLQLKVQKKNKNLKIWIFQSMVLVEQKWQGDILLINFRVSCFRKGNSNRIWANWKGRNEANKFCVRIFQVTLRAFFMWSYVAV